MGIVAGWAGTTLAKVKKSGPYVAGERAMCSRKAMRDREDSLPDETIGGGPAHPSGSMGE